MSEKSFLPFEADSPGAKIFIFMMNIIITFLLPLLLWITAFILYLRGSSSVVINFISFVPFVLIGLVVLASVRTIKTNERGLILCFGQYLGEKSSGFLYLTPLFTLETISTGNLMFQFSPRKEERKGEYAQTVTLADITTAGPTDALWDESYWTEKVGDRPTLKKKIEDSEYNKRVTLDPSVAFILKIDKPGLFLKNIPGKNVRERLQEMEKQLHTLANTVLNRELKKRVYGQLVHMMTIKDVAGPKAELNLDKIIQNEVECLIDGKVNTSDSEDISKSWGFDCINAFVPKLSASKEVHDATNQIQVTVLKNKADISSSETKITTRGNEAKADANYIKKVAAASEKAGIDATRQLELETSVEVAKGAGRTVIMNPTNQNSGGSALSDALMLELVETLKSSPSKHKKE
jgi:regulator of protease activity HflC (stomatin/prohibitin superfamily)